MIEKKILFDVTATQPIGTNKRHGGGKYGEIVLHRMLERNVPVVSYFDSNLWLNPETNEVSTEPKNGFIRGCGCHILIKMRNKNNYYAYFDFMQESEVIFITITALDATKQFNGYLKKNLINKNQSGNFEYLNNEANQYKDFLKDKNNKSHDIPTIVNKFYMNDKNKNLQKKSKENIIVS